MSPALWVEILNAVVWPFTILIILLIIRRNLGDALKRVGRVRYGDFEAVFGEAVAPAEARQDDFVPDEQTDSEVSSLNPEEKAQLEEAALAEVEAEFGEIKKHIMLFGRQDLYFDAGVTAKGSLVVFDVVYTGVSTDVPKEHFGAVSSRRRAVERAAEEKNKSWDTHHFHTDLCRHKSLCSVGNLLQVRSIPVWAASATEELGHPALS